MGDDMRHKVGDINGTKIRQTKKGTIIIILRLSWTARASPYLKEVYYSARDRIKIGKHGIG